MDGGLHPNADGTFEAGNGGANVILYIGLGMISVGLVITFVGLGEKGFKTLELKLIGPSLVGCGVFFALLRVLFCTLPSCFRWPLHHPVTVSLQELCEEVQESGGWGEAPGAGAGPC